MGPSFFTGKSGQYFCTGTSRSSFPCCQSCSAAIAVIGFETDARRKRVLEFTGTEFSRSAMPNPSDQTNWLFSTTATDIPGDLLDAMNFVTAFSICLRVAGARSAFWANERTDTQKNIRPNQQAGIFDQPLFILTLRSEIAHAILSRGIKGFIV